MRLVKMLVIWNVKYHCCAISMLPLPSDIRVHIPHNLQSFWLDAAWQAWHSYPNHCRSWNYSCSSHDQSSWQSIVVICLTICHYAPPFARFAKELNKWMHEMTYTHAVCTTRCNNVPLCMKDTFAGHEQLLACNNLHKHEYQMMQQTARLPQKWFWTWNPFLVLYLATKSNPCP